MLQVPGLNRRQRCFGGFWEDLGVLGGFWKKGTPHAAAAWTEKRARGFGGILVDFEGFGGVLGRFGGFWGERTSPHAPAAWTEDKTRGFWGVPGWLRYFPSSLLSPESSQGDRMQVPSFGILFHQEIWDNGTEGRILGSPAQPRVA